jgi:hypothetical protein
MLCHDTSLLAVCLGNYIFACGLALFPVEDFLAVMPHLVHSPAMPTLQYYRPLPTESLEIWHIEEAAVILILAITSIHLTLPAIILVTKPLYQKRGEL